MQFAILKGMYSIKNRRVSKDEQGMKKKKTFGLFGTNKRKPARKGNKRIKEYDDYYEEEEYEDQEYAPEDDEGAYYEDGDYIEEDYEYADEAQYADEEGYEDDAEYSDEAYYENESEYMDEAGNDEYAQGYEEDVEYTSEYDAEVENTEQQAMASGYTEESGYNEENQYTEEVEYIEETEYEDQSAYDDNTIAFTDAEDEYEDYYEEESYEEEEWDEDAYDTGYAPTDAAAGGHQPKNHHNKNKSHGRKSFDWSATTEVIREFVHNLTPFDVILVCTGVVLLIGAIVAGSMVLASKNIDEQIQAIVPVGTELSRVGIVGESGLLAMADARLNAAEDSSMEIEDVVYTTESSDEENVQVSVNFESVEKDLKIRFTNAATGQLITGNAFEVTLTSSQGKKLVLVDEDMDGIIYADNIKAGKFEAVITSTDKYKFPATAQQVTVKDKVEFVVINVQDEVKSEAQVNVAAEDTQKADAAKEEVKLTDTVEWVESSKTLIGGTESYLPVDKSLIQDPSTSSRLGTGIYLFDGLSVTLNKGSIDSLYVGSSETLTGTSFTDSKEEKDNVTKEYTYTTEWESSDPNIATVDGGKVTAKSAGTVTIKYTVTRKTVTTTKTPQEPIEETKTEKYTQEEYEKLEQDSPEKAAKCEKTTDESGETVYVYKETVKKEQDSKVESTETTDTGSATCTVQVKAVAISSGTLEITRSADACSVGQTLTVKPSKLVYTMNNGGTETKTDGFPTISWSSSDKAIATVDNNGTVTGVKAGKVTITGQITGVQDANKKDLTIKASTEITINAAAALTLALDRTEAWIGVNKNTTLAATVTNYKSDSGVTWTTSDKTVATVDEKGVVTGVKAGSAKITATTKEKDASGKNLTATCVVTVNSDAMNDTNTKLKDKNGNQLYVKNADGSYREAVYADYFTASEFYMKTEGQYAYTGWQTINGKTYFYDKSGKAVTGTQIIQGVTYNFGSDGAIQTSVNGSKFGIDISRHNGKIDWNAVKSSGVDYVIIRCGYRGSSSGALITDQNFQSNIKGATAAGLKVGIYVFSQAVNEVEAVKEASLAVSLAKGYKLTYPIFIDTESSGGRADKIDVATRTAVVNAFCQTVQSAGYQAGIYASKTWFETKLSMGSVGNYRIWLAQYAAAPTYSGRYDMWQYSSKGTISGINGKVDLNLSYLAY